jgi:hypothetical protein
MLALAAAGAGCGRAPDADGAPGALQAAEAAAPTLALTRDLALDGDFGTVIDVEVGDDGTVYVADFMAQQVRVFSAAGKEREPIGRQGGGPGEFRALRDLALRGDTVFALDASAQRVTAFLASSGAPVRTVAVRQGSEMANYELLAPAAGGLVLQYTTPSTEANLDEPHEVNVRVLNGDDVRPEPVFSFPDKEFLVVRDASFGFSVGLMPYGREPVLRLGPGDRLYYGRNDHVGVEVYELAGTRAGGFRQAAAAPQVHRTELEALLASLPDNRPGRMMRRTFEVALRKDLIPGTKPAWKQFLVDDRGRLWIEPVRAADRVLHTPGGLRYVSQEGSAAPSRWWIVDDRGSLAAVAVLPGNVAVRMVRGDAAWGIETDAAGVQRVVRYRVGT